MLRQRSYDSVRIISIDRDELLDRLCVAAARLQAEHPEVAAVRVFGSIARGDQVGTSDVDILVVLRGEAGGDPVEQILLFRPYFDLPVGVDVLVTTQAQLDRRLRAGDEFVERMWRESRPLHSPLSTEGRSPRRNQDSRSIS